jgi:signal transduction histidine kinase
LSVTAARLSELVAREQAFSADASHQLRSPLAALRVTMESELAHPRPDREDALREALVDIDRLEQTIDDLLALARERHQARPAIDLRRTLQLLARRWEVALADDHRRFVVEQPAALPAIRVSDAAVSHVLDVLVDNARNHGRGEVVVATRVHHRAVSVSVTDHGPGVEDPDALFARRLDGARGNGIGLALARRLAEAEGGRLILKENGPSTVFELTVPVG